MRLYPDTFKIGDKLTFQNRYGKVVLEIVSPSQPVKSIYFKDCPDECKMSFEQAEQIALITDQIRLQLVFNYKDLKGKMAFIKHDTTHSAGWVKMIELVYNHDRPAKEQIAQDLDFGRNKFFAL